MAKRIWLATHRKHVYCCSGRPHSCHNLHFLDAEANENSHPPELVRATDQINEILRELRPQAPEKRHLALIDTNVGLLLVWAEATEPPDDTSEYVTAESPQDEIAATLGLTGGDRSGA